jgi:hypothetical protein
MKILTLIPLALLAAAAHAETFHLRYEWSPSAGGPFVPVPESMIQINPDGSATVAKTGVAAFFRLNIADGSTGGGSTMPVQTFDSLPPLVQQNVRQQFDSIATEDSDEGRAWKDAELSPFVTPVTSAWNDTGVPDMVEIKITGPCDAPRTAGIFRNDEGERGTKHRGFILAGVSRKSPPIVGYKTDGETMCEELLQHCEGGEVSCIRRFGPMFIAAESRNKNVLGNLGLYPVIFPESAYEEQSVARSFSWDSESGDIPPLPKATPAGPRTFNTFTELLEAYQESPFLSARRRQREALIEFDWLVLEGKAPVLEVKPDERVSFLTDQTFTRYTLDDETGVRPATVNLGRTGVDITGGSTPGAWRLTLVSNTGEVSRYQLRVAIQGQALRNGNDGTCTTTQMWQAGTADTQPRYNQRKDLDRWCPSVGCGPVMLALMVATAEHFQNVPSAYWSRLPGASVTSRRAAMRNVDAPLKYYKYDGGVHNDTNLRYWYDWWHDQCNVTCWEHNGSGSTLPGEAGDALFTYFSIATDPLIVPTTLGDPQTGRYVTGGAHWEADGISDDWDESGIRTANAIKAGRVGGVYYMEHWHYAVAWRYRKTVTEFKVGGQVFYSTIARHFRINTGWGNSDAVWNAYDIDGCYLLNLHQNRMPPP